MKLEEGEELKGFMLSCEQNREKQAVKDAFNFLNEFIDKLYPNLEPTGPHKKHNTGQHESLESELLQLKRKENRVLFSLDTGVKVSQPTRSALSSSRSTHPSPMWIR